MNFQLSSFDAYLNFYTLIEFLILLASVLLSYYFVADNLKRFVSNKAKSKILKDGVDSHGTFVTVGTQTGGADISKFANWSWSSVALTAALD